MQYNYLLNNHPQMLHDLENEITNILSSNQNFALCSYELFIQIQKNNLILTQQLISAIKCFKNPQANPESFIGAIAAALASQNKIIFKGKKKSPKTNINEECWSI